MPPTIRVTVGRPAAAAAFEAEAPEPAVLLELPPELLAELLQAARPAARAAAPAMLANLRRVDLGIEGVLLVIGGGGAVGRGDVRWRRLRRLRPVTAGARTAGGAPAGRSGPPRSAPGPR